MMLLSCSFYQGDDVFVMGNFNFSINHNIICNVVDIVDACEYSVKPLLEDISCQFESKG